MDLPARIYNFLNGEVQKLVNRFLTMMFLTVRNECRTKLHTYTHAYTDMNTNMRLVPKKSVRGERVCYLSICKLLQ